MRATRVWWLLGIGIVLLLGGALVAPGIAQEVAPAPGQPAPEAGIVSGTVIDKSSRSPIIEAGVEVVGKGKTVRTDIEGGYKLTLPPGTYELRIFAPSYKGLRVKDVAVKPGQTTKADVAMEGAGAAGVDVVEVKAQRRKAAEASQLQERKEAPVVEDMISRESMAKTPGTDATAQVQRAPAVTIKDGKFIFVRGLSERYSSALLNGSRLPSSDPIRRAVPLDLFPAEFLDSIAIVKSFSPDLPGDFSGGLVKLDLRDLPDELTYNMGLSVGGNTQTTFQHFLTYPGATSDYFALGERHRELTLPDKDLSFPNQGRFATARKFPNVWSPHSSIAPPNFGGNLSVGNTYGPFGFQFGAIYLDEWLTRPNTIRRQFGNNGSADNPEIGIRSSQVGDSGFFRSRLGGVLTLAYKPSDQHQLTLRTFTYQQALDETTERLGFTNQAKETPLRTSVLRYVPENLSYGQLAGKHQLASWLQAEWRSVLARTLRDEPDTRFTSYIFTPGQGFTFTNNQNRGGFRYTNTLDEWLTDSGVDLTIPFKTGLPWTDVWDDLPAKFKFGPAYTFRDRHFNQREFLYDPEAGAPNLTQPPEVILAPDNLVDGIVDIDEQTDIEDHYEARQEIIAGYGLFELPIIRDRFRLVGGARTEYSLIRLDTGLIAANPGECPGGASQCDTRFRKRTLDPLPAISAIFTLMEDMQLRVSWGESVARPEFRELAPARFPVDPGERETRGNPALVQTGIRSYDARWEWFFSPLELASVGFFYKQLNGPIEPVTVATQTNPIDTWVNGGDATLYGVELEGRKNFGFIQERLRPLSLLINWTLADSNVSIPRQEVFGLTTVSSSKERRLVGQAPFIVNAALDYTLPDVLTARLLYFTADESISAVGILGLPDIEFERRDQLDASLLVPLKRWVGFPLNAKLSAENLLNDPYTFTQGSVVQQRYTNGVKFTFSLNLLSK
jgi:hypothetical protein